MDSKMNKKDAIQLTSEDLKAANGSIGLKFKTPRRPWDRKVKPLNPTEESREDEEAGN